MKTVFAISLVALLAMISPVFSAESTKNPDHLPSMSFSLGYGNSHANHDWVVSGNDLDDTELFSDTTEIAALLKLPTSDTITIFGSISYGESDFDADASPFLFVANTGEFSGWAFRIGFTKYFGR